MNITQTYECAPSDAILVKGHSNLRSVYTELSIPQDIIFFTYLGFLKKYYPQVPDVPHKQVTWELF